MKGNKLHIHHNFAAMLSIFFSWLLIWIPVKIVAASLVGRSRTADVIFGVL